MTGKTNDPNHKEERPKLRLEALEAFIPKDKKTNGDGASATVASTVDLPIISVEAGEMPRMVAEAQRALKNSDKLIFVRAGALVYPVLETTTASDDRKTTIVILKVIQTDLMLCWLAEVAQFARWNQRKKAWTIVDPPRQVATTLLVGADRWTFPRIAGVTTTPLMRADGFLHIQPGYDPVTQFYLVPDPVLSMIKIPDHPTKEDALAALSLLKRLLKGFEFRSELNLTAALSLILTVNIRPSIPLAPMHLVTAPNSGEGKSLLVDTASMIAIGRICPVTTSTGRVEEDEKKLGAVLRAGYSIMNLDNCSYDLTGDMLCQLTEREMVCIRILGLSEIPEFPCKTAMIATGINIAVKSDMNRRVVTTKLSSLAEIPEQREFEFNPKDLVRKDRAAYLGAVFTIIRAYIHAGKPTAYRAIKKEDGSIETVKCKPLGSYDAWCNVVRFPLIWLGMEDVLVSMDQMRQEDPELRKIRELFGLWKIHLMPLNTFYTPLQINEKAEDHQNHNGNNISPFLDILLRVASERGTISTRRLAIYLRKIKDRNVDGYQLEEEAGWAGGHANRFTLMKVSESAVDIMKEQDIYRDNDDDTDIPF
jgi:putative DNA primase/helicase